MRPLRKLSVLILSFFLLSNVLAVNAKALDEAACRGDYEDLTTEEQRECQKILNDRANELNEELNNLQEQIDDLKADIANSVLKLRDYEAQMAEIEAEIQSIEAQIQDLENNIKKLEQEIKDREDHIEQIDNSIKERMVALQSFIHINNYIDFLVGSTSFIDLIRRIEALNDIQKYDHDLLVQLDHEIKELNVTKETLEKNKEALEINKQAVESRKAYIEGLQKVVEELLKEYYSKKADLEAQEQQFYSDLDSVKSQLKAISERLNSVEPSPGWSRPVNGSISAETWHYPAGFGGGVHLGLDVAASVGTTIRAVANGYILFSANSCDTYGYLGSRCGYPGSNGGGNQVYEIVRVDGSTYAVKYLHMRSGTPIESGQIVNAGDKIGEVGASGNTTGPHCHIEIFYLGEESISYYVENWDGDLSFGCGWGTNGLNRLCSNTGAPCRVAPRGVLGY